MIGYNAYKSDILDCEIGPRCQRNIELISERSEHLYLIKIEEVIMSIGGASVSGGQELQRFLRILKLNSGRSGHHTAYTIKREETYVYSMRICLRLSEVTRVQGT